MMFKTEACSLCFIPWRALTEKKAPCKTNMFCHSAAHVILLTTPQSSNRICPRLSTSGRGSWCALPSHKSDESQKARATNSALQPALTLEFSLDCAPTVTHGNWRKHTHWCWGRPLLPCGKRSKEDLRRTCVTQCIWWWHYAAMLDTETGISHTHIVMLTLNSSCVQSFLHSAWASM